MYHSDLENRTLTFKKLECSGKFPIGTPRSYAFTLQLDFLENVCKTIAINYKIQNTLLTCYLRMCGAYLGMVLFQVNTVTLRKVCPRRHYITKYVFCI